MKINNIKIANLFVLGVTTLLFACGDSGNSIDKKKVK